MWDWLMPFDVSHAPLWKTGEGDRATSSRGLAAERNGGRQALRHVAIDTNYWKTFVHERLGTAMGDPGCLSIFGRKAVQHRLFAEHVTAEYRVRTEGRGRTVDEWKLPAHKPDNSACERREPAGRVRRTGRRRRPQPLV